MEIERKFTIKELPADLESYPYRHIEQGYLNTSPVVRVRREDDEYSPEKNNGEFVNCPQKGRQTGVRCVD